LALRVGPSPASAAARSHRGGANAWPRRCPEPLVSHMRGAVQGAVQSVGRKIQAIYRGTATTFTMQGFGRPRKKRATQEQGKQSENQLRRTVGPVEIPSPC